MIRQLGKQYNLPVRSAFSTVRGFYIQLPCGGKDGISARDLPPVFIKVTKVKHTLNCTTADLVCATELYTNVYVLVRFLGRLTSQPQAKCI